MFGLEHEHAWEAAKLTQTSSKRKTAQIVVPRDMLPARPYADITHMTGVQKYVYVQGVLKYAMHFMQKDQGNKVTEDDYMSALIATMRERYQDPEWILLGAKLHADRMEGRTFADMMEQICVFMRIDKSREMVLASLATQGMAQGLSSQ